MEESSLSYLVWTVVFLLLGLAMYVYFAVTLMIIARKTGTAGAGLAWIPIANLVLMCSVARRPGWWVLLLFIPVINLVVFAMIWMSIAETCGKSAYLGALAVVPIVGAFVPAFLALTAERPPEMAVGGARNCFSCGTPIIAGETFCRNCGEAAATVVRGANQNPAAVPRSSGGKLVLVGGAAALVVMLVFGVAGWFAVGSLFAYAAPEREPPAISERASGTLTEFPVDNEGDDSLAPDGVNIDDLQTPLEGGASSDKEETAKKRLPPGTSRDDLKTRGGTTLTTTIYSPRTKPEQPTAADDIYISVARVPSGNADKIAVNVAQKTGGTRTGTKVKSPKGEVYTGSKIDSAKDLIYILEKEGSDVLILIYTPNDSMRSAATRLAGNVGNGAGLNDYPETKTTLWALPNKPPSGLVLIDYKSSTRDEAGLSESDLSSGQQTREEKEMYEYVSQFLPDRLVSARYRDASRQEWEVGILDYTSSGRAWRTWFFIGWALSMSGESVTEQRTGGVLVNADGERMLMFRKGPYLIFIKAPPSENTDKIAAFGDSFQV